MNSQKVFVCDAVAVIRSEKDCIEVQEDLYSMSEWSEEWEFGFNAKKCKSMHMRRSNSNPRIVYYMKEGDERVPIHVQQVSEEKHLGVIFCDTLKLDNQIHVSNCVNKANRILGIIKHSFSSLDVDMFLQIYKTAIHPHLEYSAVIWNPYLKQNIFLIENGQCQATKLVHG